MSESQLGTQRSQARWHHSSWDQTTLQRAPPRAVSVMRADSSWLRSLWTIQPEEFSQEPRPQPRSLFSQTFSAVSRDGGARCQGQRSQTNPADPVAHRAPRMATSRSYDPPTISRTGPSPADWAGEKTSVKFQGQLDASLEPWRCTPKRLLGPNHPSPRNRHRPARDSARPALDLYF